MRRLLRFGCEPIRRMGWRERRGRDRGRDRGREGQREGQPSSPLVPDQRIQLTEKKKTT